jgi:hypothetical protein
MRLRLLRASSRRGRVGESGHKDNRMMEAAEERAPIETLLENLARSWRIWNAAWVIVH